MKLDDNRNRTGTENRNENGVCPCCPNHCPMDALQCVKGRNYFSAQAGEGTGQEERHLSGKKPSLLTNDETVFIGCNQSAIA